MHYVGDLSPDENAYMDAGLIEASGSSQKDESTSVPRKKEKNKLRMVRCDFESRTRPKRPHRRRTASFQRTTDYLHGCETRVGSGPEGRRLRPAREFFLRTTPSGLRQEEQQRAGDEDSEWGRAAAGWEEIGRSGGPEAGGKGG